MRVQSREAGAHELADLWPAASSARIFDDVAELESFFAEGPWRVRVAGRGQAAVVDIWRAHLRTMAVRALWCADRHTAAWLEDLAGLARAHGLRELLSPLLPTSLLGGYLDWGMRVVEPIVALQALVEEVTAGDVPAGVRLRPVEATDVADLVELDSACFGEFWRYGLPELSRLVARERCTVAEKDGVLIGYTLCTVRRGVVTLTRLAVAPDRRRAGLGSALIGDCARFASMARAGSIALCTQEGNAASRALYARCGFRELSERYALARSAV